MKLKNILSAAFGILLLTGCSDKEAEPLMLAVDTYTTSPVTATSNVKITSEGLWSITEKGVCWSTHKEPTINDNKSIGGKGTGNFTTDLTFLEPNTEYFIRAYAIYSGGTIYSTSSTNSYPGFSGFSSLKTPLPPSTETLFKDTLPYGSVTDIEGNQYKTVQIGTQVWMAENLKVKKYRNGEEIPNLTENAKWIAQSGGAYCDYYSPLMSDVFGRLYNWEALNSEKGLCPAGWHIPSDDEWKTLEMHLGLSQQEVDKTGERGTDQGAQLKQPGFEFWTNNEFGNRGENKLRFTALPAGFRDKNGDFKGYSATTGWWSSSAFNASNAWHRSVSIFKLHRSDVSKRNAYSVRCIKD